jgi:hypothetical protein
MLNTGAGVLLAALLFLFVLLAGVTLGSGTWRLKLAAAGAVAVFAAATLVSIPGLLGWPSTDGLPPKFRLLAVHIQQPDKQTRDAGSVYLWAIDAENLMRGVAPRAYRLPYSAPLHETAATAAAKLGKGVAQLGEFSASREPGGGWLKPATDQRAAIALRFYDVPDPLYPEG